MREKHIDGLERETAARKGKEQQGLLLLKSQQEGSGSDIQKDFLPATFRALPTETKEGEQGWPAGQGQGLSQPQCPQQSSDTDPQQARVSTQCFSNIVSPGRLAVG